MIYFGEHSENKSGTLCSVSMRYNGNCMHGHSVTGPRKPKYSQYAFNTTSVCRGVAHGEEILRSRTPVITTLAQVGRRVVLSYQWQELITGINRYIYRPRHLHASAFNRRNYCRSRNWPPILSEIMSSRCKLLKSQKLCIFGISRAQSTLTSFTEKRGYSRDICNPS